MIQTLHVRKSILLVSLLALFTMAGGMTTTLTSQDQEEATQQDQAYVVTGIEIEYAKAIPGLPDSQSIFPGSLMVGSVLTSRVNRRPLPWD